MQVRQQSASHYVEYSRQGNATVDGEWFKHTQSSIHRHETPALRGNWHFGTHTSEPVIHKRPEAVNRPPGTL